MEKKRFVSVTLVIVSLFILTLLPSLAQESPFALEEVSVLEEEFAEEVEIIEDRAGTTPDSPLYVVDEIIENVVLATKDGEEKAAYALEIKQEKVSEAALMLEKQKQEETAKALQKANSVSLLIEKELSPQLAELAKENGESEQRILAALQRHTPEGWAEVEELMGEQLTAEKKIQLQANLVPKIADYCEELSYIDYNIMHQDPYCQPENAPEWLQEAIAGEIQQREEKAIDQMVQELTTCVNDPRDCDCSDIPVDKHRQDCEENTALAIRCEFEQDMNACEELEGKPLVPEDVPEYLRPAFESTMSELIAKKEKEMFSKFAPPECVEAGLSTREECEGLMREKYGEPPEECQQDGKFIGMEECMAIMIEKYDIPSECVQSGKPISQEECQAIMISSGQIPAECVEGGEFIGREACEQKMTSGMIASGQIPEACVEGGQFIGRAECEARMGAQAQGGPEGGGGPPAECLQDGEFIGMDECTRLITEKIATGEMPSGFAGGPPGGMPGEFGSGGFPGGGGPGGLGGFPGGGGMPGAGGMGISLPEGIELPAGIPDVGVLQNAVPGGDQVLIVDDGGSHLVSREELQQLLVQAQQAAGQESEHSQQAEQLREAIEQLQEARERVERGEEVGEGIGGEEPGEFRGEREREGGGEEVHEEVVEGSGEDSEAGVESGGGESSGGGDSGGDDGGSESGDGSGGSDGGDSGEGDSGGGESSGE